VTRITCKLLSFEKGPEGIRTSDLACSLSALASLLLRACFAELRVGGALYGLMHEKG
jgi:hypothetical protein